MKIKNGKAQQIKIGDLESMAMTPAPFHSNFN
jgi:hypothetical protein